MKRNTDTFMQLGLAGVLMQYLYICPGRSIEFIDPLGVKRAVAMDADMALMVYDPTTPHSIPTRVSTDPWFWANLANYLAKQPPAKGDRRFPNYLSQIVSTMAAMTDKFSRGKSAQREG